MPTSSSPSATTISASPWPASPASWWPSSPPASRPPSISRLSVRTASDGLQVGFRGGHRLSQSLDQGAGRHARLFAGHRTGRTDHRRDLRHAAALPPLVGDAACPLLCRDFPLHAAPVADRHVLLLFPHRSRDRPPRMPPPRPSP